MQHLKAFTLVELMMVVVLIGMMAVFGIPSYTGAVQKANEKAATNNLLIIASAQKIRQNNGGTFCGDSTSPACDNTMTTINTQLGLGIIPNGATYFCDTANLVPTTFMCSASGSGFKIGGISNTVNVPCCCNGYACKSTIAACADSATECP